MMVGHTGSYALPVAGLTKLSTIGVNNANKSDNRVVRYRE